MHEYDDMEYKSLSAVAGIMMGEHLNAHHSSGEKCLEKKQRTRRCAEALDENHPRRHQGGDCPRGLTMATLKRKLPDLWSEQEALLLGEK